jgi:hypothetical protein
LGIVFRQRWGNTPPLLAPTDCVKRLAAVHPSLGPQEKRRRLPEPQSWLTKPVIRTRSFPLAIDSVLLRVKHNGGSPKCQEVTRLAPASIAPLGHSGSRDVGHRDCTYRCDRNRATHYERRHVLVLNSKTRQNSKTLHFGPNSANSTHSTYTSC